MDFNRLFDNNKRVLGIVGVIIVGLLMTSAIAFGVVQYTDILGDETDKEEKTIYDGVPNSSNVLIQADMIGLATDGATKNLANKVSSKYLGKSEGWYIDNYNKQINRTNEQLNKNIITSFDYDIRTAENAVLFADVNMSLDTNISVDNIQDTNQTNQTDYQDKFGVLVKTNITENNLVNSAKDGQIGYNFSESEYKNHTVVNINELYFVVLDDTYIGAASDMSVIEDIVDTYSGQNKSIESHMIPSDDSYMSFSVDGIDKIYSESIDSYEQFYNNSRVKEQLNESEKEQIESFFSLPSPHTMLMSYSSEDNNTMTTELVLTFNTVDMASEAENIFSNTGSNENVDVDVSISDTTVTITQETTVSNIMNTLSEVQEKYSNYSQPVYGTPEQDFNSEQDKASVSFSRNYTTDNNSISVTVERLSRNESIVIKDSENTNHTVIPATNVSNDWADADSAGQTITVDNLTHGEYIQVYAVENNSEPLLYPNLVSSYTYLDYDGDSTSKENSTEYPN